MRTEKVALVVVALLLAAGAGGRAQSPAEPQFQAGAAVDVGSFAYHRPIAAGQPGVTDLRLDAAALAHSRSDFADVRILDGNSRQVPYLIERDPSPLSIALPAPEKDSTRPAVADPRPFSRRRHTGPGEGRISRYVLRLPYSRLPEAQLVLRTPARVFQREVWVEAGPASGDDRPETDWRIVATAWWSHADPEAEAPPLTLDMGSVRTPVLHLVVDEGDNAALPIVKPTLLLPAYRVRFVRPKGPLQLVYGNRDAEAPRYDLALVARSLRQVPAEQAVAGAEQPKPSPRLPDRIVFWAVLALAVTVLVALVARLLAVGGVKH